jgi:hypothetical protein
MRINVGAGLKEECRAGGGELKEAMAEKMYLAGGGEEEKVEVSSAKIRIF